MSYSEKTPFLVFTDNYDNHLNTPGTIINSCLSLLVSSNTLRWKLSASGKPVPALIMTASTNVLLSEDEVEVQRRK